MAFADRLSSHFRSGLAGKLIRFSVIFVACLGLIFLFLFHFRLDLLLDLVSSVSEKETDLVQDKYRESMSGYTQDSLLQTIIWAADKTDDEFWIMDHDFRVLASQTEDVFRRPEAYDVLPVEPPAKENAGRFTLQVLCQEGYRNLSPATVETLGRLANLGPTMKEIVEGNEGYTLDCYIVLPDGTALAMDDLSDGKFDADGKLIPYDATSRAWYAASIEEGNGYFSPAMNSHFYDFRVVVYGLPVYVDGELKAVIMGSSRLDVLQEILTERNIGEKGFSVLITDKAQLVCSPRQSGELVMSDNPLDDIRNRVNPELKKMIDCALSGETRVDEVTVDGEKYFAAHAPLDVVGGTQIIFVNTDEIMSPMNELTLEMDIFQQNAFETIRKSFRRSHLLLALSLAVIMVLSIISVTIIARKWVHPIKSMTNAVSRFVGDEMAFEMEDVYKTGDEVQILAESFETMSGKMKQYLREIVQHTAEKERMDAEISLAARIQASMLPKLTPEITEDTRFEIHACSQPAKNVGGDFYDFFLPDKDHLAIVIGDVSGKGISAALFMALSKQMIKSQLLLCGDNIAEAVNNANLQLIEENDARMFVTAWIGVITLSTGVLRFVDAGHLYAAMRKNSGSFTIDEDKHSFLLGGLKQASYTANETVLAPGDMLYLYTDGITEANNTDQEMFGSDRLLKVLNEVRDRSPQEIDDHVRAAIAEFSKDTEQFDDITSLCFRYTAPGNNERKTTCS